MEEELIKWIKDRYSKYSIIVSKFDSKKKEDFTSEEEEFIRNEFDCFFNNHLLDTEN